MGYVTRVAIAISLSVAVCSAYGARISDVRNTAHNFSVTGPGSVKAVSETQICVFCHTPHMASTLPGAPLWNRNLSTQTYTLYDSSSMDAARVTDGSNLKAGSKLCLSCHDGTLAIGSVNVLNGKQNQTIAMTGTNAGKMPDGAGAKSGFTRNLGTDLTNDHPIAISYDTAFALTDGDMRMPGNTVVGNRVAGQNKAQKPALPLVDNSVECVSCHDPHVRDATDENIKFLRLNRFQTNNSPTGTEFNTANDIICLGCHSKDGWVDSAHANTVVADETYTSSAAALRDFPQNVPVWRAACLNCHDTHTVQGSRRLLREGVDGVGVAGAPKLDGKAAIEETCYQCHSNNGGVLNGQGTLNFQVPDIKTDFTLPNGIRMPITSTEQATGHEVHDIGTMQTAFAGKDLLESQALLGKGNLSNRHAECTDCHNPHRVAKNNLFNDNPQSPDAEGTHSHTDGHSNLASGVLRGSWGVEPKDYTGNAFLSMPLRFDVKRGLAPTNGSTLVDQPYVTREYQICLKCHSNYAYNDNGKPWDMGSGRPPLGNTGGGTAPGTNGGVMVYTNQAMEYHSPDSHMGETTTTDSGADLHYSNNNHRSWHPVMKETGRTKLIRGMSSNSNSFHFPWNNTVGTQTMYCSDCHGSDTTGQTVVPNGGINGNPWGPHGSINNFLLKGKWDCQTGTPGGRAGYQCAPRSDQSEDLCFKCHNQGTYAGFGNGDGDGNGGGTGFSDGGDNLHLYHIDKSPGEKLRCNWCHVAVPHGWKNKALLVNLNDIGEEIDLDGLMAKYPGRLINHSTPAKRSYEWSLRGTPAELYAPPYYNGSMNKFYNFARSGNWDESDCGSRSGEGGRGEEWMEFACERMP